jgi:hypothetical protein
MHSVKSKVGNKSLMRLRQRLVYDALLSSLLHFGVRLRAGIISSSTSFSATLRCGVANWDIIDPGDIDLTPSVDRLSLAKVPKYIAKL